MAIDRLEAAHQLNAARRAITDFELELSPGMDCPIDTHEAERYCSRAMTALNNVLIVMRNDSTG